MPDKHQANFIANLDKVSLLREQLNYCRHAVNCDNIATNKSLSGVEKCHVKLCPMMKGVFAHMPECNNEFGCKYTYCSSSRYLLRHFVGCADKWCPVCPTSEKPQKELDDVVKLIHSPCSSGISFPWVMSEDVPVRDPGDLFSKFLPVWEKIHTLKHRETRLPLDEETQNEKQYDLLFIPNPKSLELIKEKLDNREYKTGLRFARDMWILLENFWEIYATVDDTSEFYYSSLNLAYQLQRALDPILLDLGYKRKLSSAGGLLIAISKPILANLVVLSCIDIFQVIFKILMFVASNYEFIQHFQVHKTTNWLKSWFAQGLKAIRSPQRPWHACLPVKIRRNHIWKLMVCVRPDVVKNGELQDELVKFCAAEELDAFVRGADIQDYFKIIAQKIQSFKEKLAQVKNIAEISADDHSLNLDIVQCCFEVQRPN